MQLFILAVQSQPVSENIVQVDKDHKLCDDLKKLAEDLRNDLKKLGKDFEAALLDVVLRELHKIEESLSKVKPHTELGQKLLQHLEQMLKEIEDFLEEQKKKIHPNELLLN